MNKAKLFEDTRVLRGRMAKLLLANAGDADRIPAGWNNNVRWHAGHLLVTPRRLTSLLLGRPDPLPQEYHGWFMKGTSPRDWGMAPVPKLEDIVPAMLADTEALLREMEPRLDEHFAQPYETSVGIVLRCPGDGLLMSFMHDGIHLGMLLAMQRALR